MVLTTRLMWESADEAAAGLVTMTIWLPPLKDLTGSWLLDDRIGSWSSEDTPTLFTLPVRGKLDDTHTAERPTKTGSAHVDNVRYTFPLLKHIYSAADFREPRILCFQLPTRAVFWHRSRLSALEIIKSAVPSFWWRRLCVTLRLTCCDELGAGFSFRGGGFWRFWAGLLVLGQLDGHGHLTQVNGVLPGFGLRFLLHYMEGKTDLVLIWICG